MSDSYLKYWGLQKPLFLNPPFGEQVFVSEQMQWFYNKMVEPELGGMRRFVAISGESGVGKSVFAQWLYKELPFPEYEVVYWSVVKKSRSYSGRFTDKLIDYLGVQVQQSEHELMAGLAKELEQLASRARKLVLLIDAGEQLDFSEDLLSLRSLTHLMQLAQLEHTVCVIGNKGLMSSIENYPDLVPKYFQMWMYKPLEKQETSAFVDQMCSWSNFDPNLFAADVLDSVYSSTHGNIEQMSQLLERSLVQAANSKSKKILLDHLKSPDSQRVIQAIKKSDHNLKSSA